METKGEPLAHSRFEGRLLQQASTHYQRVSSDIIQCGTVGFFPGAISELSPVTIALPVDPVSSGEIAVTAEVDPFPFRIDAAVGPVRPAGGASSTAR